MRRRNFMAGTAVLLITCGISAASAAEPRKGGTAQVVANSIWFEDAGKLARWQELKKAGNSAAFTAYQDGALSNRDAWQFNNPLSVKILSYDPNTRQVKVEMTTQGRYQGTTWFLDVEAIP